MWKEEMLGPGPSACFWCTQRPPGEAILPLWTCLLDRPIYHFPLPIHPVPGGKGGPAQPNPCLWEAPQSECEECEVWTL